MSRSEIYIHDVQVDSSFIDVMGHANNVAYVGWMQDAAVAHSTANGWSWQQYQEKGVAWVAREHWIEYILPAFLDDRIQIETWVSELKKVSSTRSYEFQRLETGDTIARAWTRWAFVKIESGTPVRVPSEIASSFVVLDRSTR